MVIAFMTKWPRTGQPTGFVDKILSGSKRFTLRRYSKRQYRVGMVLQMCTDVRTKAQKQFASSSVADLGRVRIMASPKTLTVQSYIDGQFLTLEGQALTDFAKADGFDTLGHFEAYWRAEYGKELVKGEIDGLWLELEQIIWDLPTPFEGLI